MRTYYPSFLNIRKYYATHFLILINGPTQIDVVSEGAANHREVRYSLGDEVPDFAEDPVKELMAEVKFVHYVKLNQETNEITMVYNGGDIKTFQFPHGIL